MPDPTVSIIIPTYRRPRHLGRCLDSVLGAVDVPHEVICVSVAGDDETAAVIDSRGPRHIVQPDRGGMVQATNLGFRAAKGKFVTQVNDDCELMPHSVSNAVRFLEAPPHGGIGQAALFHDSPVRRNVHQQIRVEDTWYFVCQVRGLCYANFGLVRRTLGEQLGWLDERYFMYGADPDFSLKVWHEAKLAVAPCPGSLVHHLELTDDRAAAERAHQQADNEKLFAKWGM